MVWAISLAGVGVVLALLLLSPLLCSSPPPLQLAVRTASFLMVWVGVSETLIRKR